MEDNFKSKQFEETLKYFNGDELAATTWINKYALNGELTPDDMHRRMAKEYFRVEKEYIKSNKCVDKSILSEYGRTRQQLTEESIYQYFKGFKGIVPGGSVMAGLGSGKPVSLSNCFVIASPEDSYGSIMDSRTHQVQLAKRRGGVGKDLSNLRPKGSFVNNAAKTSTGAVSFMEVDSHIINEVAQSGRRGALMITMSVNHPDIIDFINIKQDLTKVTGANISVKFTDEFMEAVENDSDYILKFPVDVTIPNALDLGTMGYNELHPYKVGEETYYFKKVEARKVWDEYVKCSHRTAEPGGIYETRMHKFSPDGVYPHFKMVSTNPCGEIGMGPLDACRLTAVNYSAVINNPYTTIASLNENVLYELFYEGMRLIDNLIELECEQIDKIISLTRGDNKETLLWSTIKENMLKGRRTGLGFTAYGDMIAMMGLKYGSKEAYDLTEKIGKIKFQAELDSTIDMAIERGVFESYDGTLEYVNGEPQNEWYDFVLKEFPEIAERMQKYGRRNISFSTVAPTGTLSMLTQTSSGLEPVFSPFYERKRKIANENERVDFVDKMGEKYTKFVVVHHGLKSWALETMKDVTLEMINEWDLDEWQEAFEKSPYYQSTAPEINWRDRVELQSLIQRYITHSISSTINLPKETTEEEISNIFLTAWKSGSKGQTVYRDGSRDGVLTTVGSGDKSPCQKLMETNAPKRPKSLPCEIVRFTNNHEKWIAVVGLYEGRPYEIFTGLLDKLNIPSNVKNGFIVKNKIIKKILDEETMILTDTKCSRYDIVYVDVNGEKNTIEGLSDAFNKEYWNYAKIISGVLRHGMPLLHTTKLISSLSFDNDTINSWKGGVLRALKKFLEDGETGDKCPKCEGKLRREGGCIVCPDCGHDKCGN